MTIEPEEEGGGVYNLVMPFVVTKSHGGPFEDEAFVAGCYMGQIEAVMQACKTTAATLRWTVDPRLLPQLDLLAMRHGYKMSSEPWDEHPDEWTFVTFEKVEQ